MQRKPQSPRARWWWAGAAGLVLTGLVVGALVFQPWLLFVDVRVDDDIPAAGAVTASASPTPETEASEPTTLPAPDEAAAPPAAPAPPVDLLAGTFVSHEHTTAGSARVLENPDGTRQLAIEGLETTNGPDVHVWLSAGPVVDGFDGWFTAAGYEYVDLGPIKGNLGNQLYDIPPSVDLAAFRTVDLWCVQFSVSFGAAALS